MCFKICLHFRGEVPLSCAWKWDQIFEDLSSTRMKQERLSNSRRPRKHQENPSKNPRKIFAPRSCGFRGCFPLPLPLPLSLPLPLPLPLLPLPLPVSVFTFCNLIPFPGVPIARSAPRKPTAERAAAISLREEKMSPKIG